MSVVVSIKKGTSIASINLAYHVGSKNERLGKHGMAHLFEHLMFEGTKTLEKNEFDRLCSLAGGTNNAFTTYDITAYTMTLPSSKLELAMMLESDRMLNFAVSAEALELQKRVVIEEIKQTVENQPYAVWREILCSKAFSDSHPYSWEVYGSVVDVDSVTLEDIDSFHSEFYSPSNACLAVSGDVEPETVFALAEKYFGCIDSNAALSAKTIQTNGNIFCNTFGSIDDSVPSPATFISFHLPSFLDDSIVVADIISSILGSGRSSRLFKKLVDERQIASYVGAFADKRELSSLLTVYAFANSPSVSADELYDAVMAEISQFLDGSDFRLEAEKSVNKIITQTALDLLHSSSVAEILSQQTLFWNDPYRFHTLIAKYEALDYNTILNFAQKYITKKNSVRVDVNPKSEGML